MLAMRHADLLELKERAVKLSKRMWESTHLPKDLAPLRRPHVVLGLVRWYAMSHISACPKSTAGVGDGMVSDVLLDVADLCQAV